MVDTTNPLDPVQIQLTEDDMYADGYIVPFDDGTMILQRDLIEHELSTGDNYVETINGQDLTQLAYSEYITSKLWWQIADVNNVFNPFPFGPNSVLQGTGLIIPQIINPLGN